MEKDRAIIFIDHANVFQNLKHINGRIDYLKLKIILSNRFHLVGACIFLGLLDKVSEKQKEFFKSLKRSGYYPFFKRVQKTHSGKYMQKGIDISIFTNVLKLAEVDSYDVAILVTGDGDFVDLVGLLAKDNKKIEIWSFKKSLSYKLKKAAGSENVHYIDDILDDIEYKPDI